MIKYIINRIFHSLLIILGVIILVFALFNLLPGDPARMMLGQRADIESIENINKELGLDKPLHMQFFIFFNDISFISIHKFDNDDNKNTATKYAPFITLMKFKNNSLILKKPFLKYSYQSKRKVSDIIMQAFPNTLILATSAMLIAFVIGVAAGIIAALFKDTWFDKTILIISVFGMSLPSFFAAILISWIFAFLLSDITGLSMFGSLYSVDDFGNGEYLSLKNLILPAITLGIRPLAVIIELTRSSLLDVLSQDYIRTAKAKGLSMYKIIKKHALKNALNPIITSISGWYASLLAGAVFVEYVFDWKGIGVVIVDALEKYDFPVLIGAILLIAVIIVIINILTDILYSILDPRIRLTA